MQAFLKEHLNFSLKDFLPSSLFNLNVNTSTSNNNTMNASSNNIIVIVVGLSLFTAYKIVTKHDDVIVKLVDQNSKQNDLLHKALDQNSKQNDVVAKLVDKLLLDSVKNTETPDSQSE